MASTKLNAINSVLIKRLSPNENFASGASAEIVNKNDERLIFQFAAPSEELKYKILTTIYAGFYISASDPLANARYSLALMPANGSNVVDELTWNNSAFTSSHPFVSVQAPGTKWDYSELGNTFASYIQKPLTIIPSGSTTTVDSIVCYTEKSAFVPYLEIIHEDNYVNATVTGQNFTSGFYNRFDAFNPKWTFTQVEESIGKLTAAAETFYWRKSGSSTWNSIKGSGGKCYVPANTFPAGDIEWYAAVTDNLGRVWSSPTYTISTADTAAIATPQSPKGGFANEQAPITFSWLYSSKYNKQSKVEIQWGLPSESWQNLATVEGDVRAYTAPAGSIDSAETVWWRIRAYNADGVAGDWSDAVSFTTTDSAAVGTPLSPSNTVEDGSGPITFMWKHANNTGTGQTKANLQWSSDGSTWQDLATVSGSGKSYTAPANTFPAGTVYWRVRTYNSDGVAGAWSAPITFVSVAAPPAPVVAADSKPYTTITWQSSGQLAYNIAVDGVEYGPRFGADKSITLKERLENGLHRATVKVQGMYGLWSEAGAVDFQISNVPGTEIKLKVRFDHAALLRWNTDGAYSAYQIYRNGKLIGKTTGTSFVDNLAIGQCSFQVIGIMADGNYSESNSVKGQINLTCTMICDLERGEWQKLELSAKSYPERNFSLNQQSSSRHFCGAALPVLELSQHRNISGSYEAAFKCRKDAEAFEALLGKVVCIKSKPADMIIGGLLDLQKLQGEFYAAYSFTVNAVYWEDYKDETDS